MNRLCLGLVLLALSTACGEELGGRGEGSGATAVTKGDDLDENTSTSSGDDVPSTAHAESVAACEAVAEHTRAHVNDARTDALVDLERERNDCLVEANDAARERIDAMLASDGDSWAGQTAGLWDAQRAAAITACNALVGADDAGAERRPYASAGCVALSELHFATVLDAYVDFGDVPSTIAGNRDRYPSCYSAYDDAKNGAAGADPLAENVAAEEQLADCLGAVHEELAPELAARVVELDPTKDALQVETELRDAFAASVGARAKICIVAAHAGVRRMAPEVDLERAECLVDAAVQAGDVVAFVAPELLGDATDDGAVEESGSDDAGTTDDAGTDDASSESSTTY
jgi:hypothetical protein